MVVDYDKKQDMQAKEFLLNLPNQVKPEVIEGHNTNFHFLLDGDDGDAFTMQIIDGVITAEEGLHGEAKCVVKSSSENMTKLINKDLKPLMAIMTGKLKISNQGEMLKYAKILGLM